MYKIILKHPYQNIYCVHLDTNTFSCIFLRTLYSQITGTTEIDIKNSPSYELSYKNSSKYGITSQYPPCDVDGALHRRIQFVVFSDWYHEIGAATTFLTCIAKKFRKTKFLTKSCALQF